MIKGEACVSKNFQKSLNKKQVSYYEDFNSFKMSYASYRCGKSMVDIISGGNFYGIRP